MTLRRLAVLAAGVVTTSPPERATCGDRDECWSFTTVPVAGR